MNKKYAGKIRNRKSWIGWQRASKETHQIRKSYINNPLLTGPPPHVHLFLEATNILFIFAFLRKCIASHAYTRSIDISSAKCSTRFFFTLDICFLHATYSLQLLSAHSVQFYSLQLISENWLLWIRLKSTVFSASCCLLAYFRCCSKLLLICSAIWNRLHLRSLLSETIWCLLSYFLRNAVAALLINQFIDFLTI